LALIYSPAENTLIGWKHESFDRNAIKLGKFWSTYYYTPRPGQAVSSEFGYDVEKRAIDARAGFVHAFTNDLTGKFKINSVGQFDTALKYKISDSVTTTFTSGLNVRTIVDSKAPVLPVGV
jgi:hypothetical protein